MGVGSSGVGTDCVWLVPVLQIQYSLLVLVPATGILQRNFIGQSSHRHLHVGTCNHQLLGFLWQRCKYSSLRSSFFISAPVQTNLFLLLLVQSFRIPNSSSRTKPGFPQKSPNLRQATAAHLHVTFQRPKQLSYPRICSLETTRTHIRYKSVAKRNAQLCALRGHQPPRAALRRRCSPSARLTPATRPTDILSRAPGTRQRSRWQ